MNYYESMIYTNHVFVQKLKLQIKTRKYLFFYFFEGDDILPKSDYLIRMIINNYNHSN